MRTAVQPTNEAASNRVGDGKKGPVAGYLMLGVAFVTCPCHLPILAVLLAGTAAGAFVKDNLVMAAVALTGFFLVSLLLGLRWTSTQGKARGE